MSDVWKGGSFSIQLTDLVGKQENEGLASMKYNTKDWFKKGSYFKYKKIRLK